ncbi:MAG: amino acid racemase [Gemmatimonadaceae bacterium]
MKTAGIIGGIGPESTINYYRQIVELYRERTQDGSYPALIINSIDLTRMLVLMGAGRLDELADFLLDGLATLHRAGAAFGAITSNTPHVIFDELQRRSTIPLISIVETAARAAKAQGVRRAALIGTRFTMGGKFYPETFAALGVEIITPAPDEQAFIHDKYMSEFLIDDIRPETRSALLAIIEKMRAREDFDALVLGGTELPLILRSSDYPSLPMLDTTQLHVAEIVAQMTKVSSQAAV